jgi:hypothetical protein
MYARRAGVKMGTAQRWALSTFIFGTYFTAMLRSEVSLLGSSYYGISYPGFGVPAWMATAAAGIMFAGGALFLLFALDWSRENRRFFPFLVLLPSITQYVWFLQGASVTAFALFVPAFHAIQYLPVAWAMELGEPTSEAPSLRFVLKRTTIWSVVNLAGGAALFYVLPHWIARLGFDLVFATGVMIAAVQIHHFFVDGVIWKLRHSRVSSPLMAHLSDYLSAPVTNDLKVAA